MQKKAIIFVLLKSTGVLGVLNSRFEALGVGVLIPTYNNEGTLAAVICAVRKHTSYIIVVDDGSTDDTAVILRRFPELTVITGEVNRGKGYALRQGFQQAAAAGFRYVVTIDSDGQHDADDLPLFLDAIERNPDSIIIGARDLNQENVPGKSSFGNRFSNFWFWVETGITLPDTQSGYRMYPLAPTNALRYFTTKYEFEIESLVRLSWSQVPIHSIAIAVYYPEASERVSHFRPFKDFVRISILNTVLTLIALLWIHPRNLFWKLRKREGWRALYRQAFHDPRESPKKKALSIAFGVFMGIIPVWGFQLAIGIPLAFYFKLNKALFLIAANISIFPVTPLIWGLSLWVGKVLLGYHDWRLSLRHLTLEQVKEAGFAFFFGGAVLAVVSGVIAFLVSMLVLSRKRRRM